MHYQQTIIDAVTTALNATTILADRVSSEHRNDVVAPAARVWSPNENLVPDLQSTSKSVDVRTMSLQVQVKVASNTAQQDSNEICGEIEQEVITAGEAVADCVRFITRESEYEFAQDHETGTIDLIYQVDYKTVVGDPTTRA